MRGAGDEREQEELRDALVEDQSVIEPDLRWRSGGERGASFVDALFPTAGRGSLPWR